MFYVDGKRSDTLDTILSPMNEAYFGKSPELLAIEKKIGEVRNEYDSDHLSVNSSKELRDLSRMIADFFGFKEFYLAVDMTGNFNAYTYPISNMIGAGNPKKYVILSKNGYKYSKDAGYSMMIYIHKGLFFNDKITNGEILAVLLHEIGHNFQASLNDVSLGFSYVQRAIAAILLPVYILLDIPQGSFKASASLTKVTRDAFIDTLNNWRKNNPSLIRAYDTAANIVKSVLGIGFMALDTIATVQQWFNPIGVFANAFYRLVNTVTNPQFILDLPSILIGFKNESLADNFATIYGYGPELSSGHKKMRDLDFGILNRQTIRNMPFLGSYTDFLNIPSLMIYSIIDPHPDYAFRVNDQIKLLKNELKKDKNMPPRMKADINHQIAEIEKTLKDFTDVNQRGFEYSNSLANLSLVMFGGDWRSFLANGNTRDFDRLYDYAQKNTLKKQAEDKERIKDKSVISKVKFR